MQQRGGRRARVAHEPRHGHAHDVAVAHHRHRLAAHAHALAAEQLGAPQRRARHERRPPHAAHGEPPDVVRVQPVHVLPGVYALQQPALAEVARNGQLQQHAVHVVVLVQPAKHRAHRLLVDVPGEVLVEEPHARRLARLALAPHVQQRVRAVAHHHRGEAGGGDAQRLAAARDGVRDLALPARRVQAAVQKARGARPVARAEPDALDPDARTRGVQGLRDAPRQPPPRRARHPDAPDAYAAPNARRCFSQKAQKKPTDLLRC